MNISTREHVSASAHTSSSIQALRVVLIPNELSIETCVKRIGESEIGPPAQKEIREPRNFFAMYRIAQMAFFLNIQCHLCGVKKELKRRKITQTSAFDKLC